MNPRYRHGKRLFDLAIALSALIIIFPLYGGIALYLLIRGGIPVFFKQVRPGIRSKPFIIFKFRTMTDLKDLNGKELPDHARLTAYGRFLRKTSLDELPELWNVLKGEMSLVGPRPLLIEYLDLYNREQARRHEVKPGITGLTQVNGRNALSWAQKFAFDVWYVDHLSFWLDLEILGLTVLKIIKCENINQPGKATMKYFQGTGGKYEG